MEVARIRMPRTGNWWSAESGSFWIVIMEMLTPAALYSERYFERYSAYDAYIAGSSSIPGLAEFRIEPCRAMYGFFIQPGGLHEVDKYCSSPCPAPAAFAAALSTSGMIRSLSCSIEKCCCFRSLSGPGL